MKRKLMSGWITVFAMFAVFLFSGITSYAATDRSARPWIYGDYSNYKSRSGKLVIDIENYSTKTITITRDSAKMINTQSKSYDVTLKAVKAYKIKPGKTVRVTFKRTKGNFSGDITDYKLSLKMNWKGKKYPAQITFCNMSVWHYDYSSGDGWWEPDGTGWEDAKYKTGGHWKSIEYDIYDE